MFTLIYYLGLISTTKHISTTLVFRFQATYVDDPKLLVELLWMFVT